MKFLDWQTNPGKYATPKHYKEQENLVAEKEIKVADPDFEKKYDFAQNEKMFEKQGDALKFNPTPNYTSYKSDQDRNSPAQSKDADNVVDPNKEQ